MVNISFDGKDDVHIKDIKNLEVSQRSAILEKALSTFYKKNVKIDFIK